MDINSDKILFLDFDGVMNTPNEAFQHTLNQELVQMMGIFCYKKDIKVVFSTAWRLHKNFNTPSKLKNYLVDFGFPQEVECIDMTPDLRYMNPKGYNNYGEYNMFPLRGYEIRQWLALNPEYPYYVIVDDIGGQFFDDQHIVQTNDLIGITKKDLEKISKLFTMQIN